MKKIDNLNHIFQDSVRVCAGFAKIKIHTKDASHSFIREWLPGKRIEDYLVPATIEAVKPTA